MRRGFSLVELSIVLVILGLLTGGILAGQSLIRASELRSVTVDYQRYATAAYAFRDKYFSIPGDMTNATLFWGKDNANCPSDNGNPSASGTCNGNGNGALSFAPVVGGSGEAFQFWKQLALAGLIEGTYSGLAGAGGTAQAVIGTNVPRSRISNGGFTAVEFITTGDSSNYAMNYGNQLTFGAANGIVDTSSPIIKPEEAWNIDTKLDDGRPGQGKIIGVYWSACATSTLATDLNGNYALNNTGNVCALRYRNLF